MESTILPSFDEIAESHDVPFVAGLIRALGHGSMEDVDTLVRS